ncbi:MAG: DUF3445 domain-containing protein [Pseudomonadota bacterium]
MLDLPPLFKVGLTPLTHEDWLMWTDDLSRYLREKERLFAERMQDVFVAEPDTEPSQNECLDLVRGHIFERPDLTDASSGNGREGDAPPLIEASRLVADDLVIMRRGAKAWRLAAACVCFPSSWDLRQKFAKPMDEIHGSVPGFSQGTRHAQMISRIFDHLDPAQLLLRWNWSLYRDDKLYHPVEAAPVQIVDDDIYTADPFIRTERQTLRKMPVSGDILFAIGIDVKRLSDLPKTAEARQNIRTLAQHLDMLTADECAYKGLTETRHALVQTMSNW